MGQPELEQKPDAPRRLSRERILETAIGLFASEGEDAVTMRRIALELDVWPMGLYRYFADKDALLDALAEVAAAKLEVPAAGGSWRERLGELVGELEATFLSNPGALRLRLADGDLAPAARRVRDSGVGLLVDAGLPSREAEQGWRALVNYAYGAAANGGDADAGYGLELLLDGLERRAAYPVNPVGRRAGRGR